MPVQNLFRASRTESRSSPTAARVHAPGTRIGFDPLLVGRLRGDHQRMLDMLAAAQELLSTRDYDGVKRKLGELRIVLQDHLMTTSVRFYIYISRQLAFDPAQSAIVSEHRREMLDNSRVVMDFLRTYSAVRLDDSFADVFQTEFLAISAALVQRMEREESTLFPLYRATY